MLLLRLLIWIYSRHANYKHMALWKINFSINAIRNTNLHTYKHTKMTLYLLISNAKWLLCQYCFPTCMLNCTWCANRSGPLITARLQSQTCSEPIVYIHVQRTLRRPYTRQHVACNSMNFSNLVASNPLIYWNFTHIHLSCMQHLQNKEVHTLLLTGASISYCPSSSKKSGTTSKTFRS